MNGRDRPPEWPVRPERNAAREDDRVDRNEARSTVARQRSGVNWTTLALIGGLLVLVALVAYFATSRNPDQDKLTTGDSGSRTASADDPQKLCASRSTYDLIKRDLFRRAAQVRGSDQAAFDKLSSYAALRMENPVMESQDGSNGAVKCSGSLSLDLPPGIAVVGGRRTLSSDVDYTVQRAADGSGTVVLLRNADAVITPLATLARTGAAPSAPATPAPAAPTDEPATSTNEPQAPVQAQPEAPRPQPAAPASARPSFNCGNARTKGEVAVCSDAGLAALDRNMAAQYGRAMSAASAEQQALLRRTRDRFLSYRDHCPNRSCMGDAYVGRMREIRDIMEGRWQPPR